MDLTSKVSLVALVILLAIPLPPAQEYVPEVKPIEPHYEEEHYQVGTHYYPATTIAFAVAIREGSIARTGGFTRANSANRQVCGIKGSNGYIRFGSVSEGLQVCSQLLGRALGQQSYAQALSRWKTGNSQDKSEATKKYIQDIENILYKNAYSYEGISQNPDRL